MFTFCDVLELEGVNYNSQSMKKYYRNLFALVIMMLGLLTSTQAQVPSYVPTTGLVSWYPFNGNSIDESGYGRNALSSATLTEDRFGNSNSAYVFTGSEYMLVSNMPSLSNGYTYSAWAKSNLTAQQAGILVQKGVGSNGSYGLSHFQTVYNCRHRNSSSGLQDITALNPTDTLWHHLVSTWDGSTLKLYIDGVLNGSLSVNTFYPFSTELVIGALHIGNAISFFYSGKIDDVAVWNRPLSPAEILDLYNGGCKLTFNLQPQNASTTVGSNATFIVAVQNANPTYQWQANLGTGWVDLFSAGQFSGAATNALTVNGVNAANSNQAFRCLVTKNGCTDTSDAALLTVSGIGIEESNAQKITIFPNPATNHFKVKVPSLYVKGSITVSDVLGRIIETQIINGEEVEVSMPQGFKGLVLVKLEDDNSSLVYVERVLIQ